jgi:hypothetical protein
MGNCPLSVGSYVLLTLLVPKKGKLNLATQFGGKGPGQEVEDKLKDKGQFQKAGSTGSCPDLGI